MTELFESSLSLIVLAIIVSVRLVLFLRKRAESRARNQPPPLDGVEAIESEGAVLALNDDDDDEDFSAWALSVDPRQEPVQPPAAPVRDAGFFPTVPPPAIPEAAPVPAFAIDAWQKPHEEGPAASVLAETRRARAGGAFWRKLMDLPPLTQGVILSEILGPPRGL